MQAKISEIFQSIQGEGPYTGVQQVFVRFFECHMHCVWCDTPDSIGDGRREYKEYALNEIWESIKPLMEGCHSVSLTGGEPLLQADFIKELIPLLKPSGLKIYLETSGVLYKELKKIVEDIDIIAMDIKLPSSTQCRSFWKEHEEFLKLALKKEVFIKTVIAQTTKLEDIQKATDLVVGLNPHLPFILQPNSFELSNGVVDQCLEYYDYCLKHLSDVRILPQMHKFLKVR